MKHSWRITKYWQRMPEGYLCSSPEEWTDFGDVGKRVSLEDYLVVEDAYLDAIRRFCVGIGVEALSIQSLERRDSRDYHEGQPLDLDGIERVARDVLRNVIWCKLVGESAEVHFGYDYYMFAVSSVDASAALAQADPLLNIEPFLSPYLPEQQG
ncbi:hypothetical protein [Stenotrophomonas sp. PFBMAA-4]|uniref:hypothetical protein n=1 Tax=Stenotrophomonas sp. PFBMAA-4 TaxID=3043301 RepID=UPI0024B59253|nr:hypothetical protein [Stenotrophomonas sp. PFBMAA-4]MDI9272911.1 hypothetical protein [Stenotrophomonas sp. PFBMAA-4]